MKALVYMGVKTLEFKDVPDPVLTAGDSLVKIESIGICGSDMHAYLGHDARRPAPLILGHEAAGNVIDGEMKGERVTINPLVTCLECDYCKSGRHNLCQSRQIISMMPREGAFAQMVAIPARNLTIVPDDVPFDKAALAEPLACGWHGVRLAEHNLHMPIKKAKALVFGGGAIGLGAALSLVAHGVSDVTLIEPNALRRNLLVKIDNINVVASFDDTMENQFDICIDGVGYEATRANASMATRAGGVIIHIGLGSSEGGLDIRKLTLQEITFIGTYTYTPDDFNATAAAIFDGRLGALDWMEVRPLSAGAEAFDDLLNGKSAAPKIILRLWSTD